MMKTNYYRFMQTLDEYKGIKKELIITALCMLRLWSIEATFVWGMENEIFFTAK